MKYVSKEDVLRIIDIAIEVHLDLKGMYSHPENIANATGAANALITLKKSIERYASELKREESA